jgi:ribosomal protein L10
VADLKENLSNSVIVFGMRFKGLDVSPAGEMRARSRPGGGGGGANGGRRRPPRRAAPRARAARRRGGGGGAPVRAGHAGRGRRPAVALARRREWCWRTEPRAARRRPAPGSVRPRRAAWRLALPTAAPSGILAVQQRAPATPGAAALAAIGPGTPLWPCGSSRAPRAPRAPHPLQVPTVQQFRKGLPEKSKVMVTKNTLMRVACKETEGWSTMVEKGCNVSPPGGGGGGLGARVPHPRGQGSGAPALVGEAPGAGPPAAVAVCRRAARRGARRPAARTARGVPATPAAPGPRGPRPDAPPRRRPPLPPRHQGENAWVFVHEDEVADVVKYFNSFVSTLEKEAKAAAPKGVEVKAPTEVTAVVMDNKYLTPAEFKRCENLPNKKQLIGTIARMLKQPARKIALGVAAVPRKLAYGVKALSELDEDKTKVVGDVAKPKAE